MKNPGIYILTCKINQKKYVGLDSKLPFRANLHLSGNEKSCPYIHNAIKKYEKDNFDVEIIQYPSISQEALKSVEQVKIATLKTQSPNGYNLTAGGDGTFQYKFTKEHREKLSQAGSKRKHSKETREKMREAWKKRKNSTNPKQLTLF